MTTSFAKGISLSGIAESIFSDVFRIDFTGAGFALIPFPDDTSSYEIRDAMIDLIGELNIRLMRSRRKALQIQSLARFDQQTTTKFHLDGGPDESILMLGYEPSAVKSLLQLADYTRAAHDMKMEPKEFMDQYNPMFAIGENMLTKYITTLDDFDHRRSQIVLINNSQIGWSPQKLHSLGVLHQASILNPDPKQSRIINSMMLAVVSPETPQLTTIDEINRFRTTDSVATKNYST